MFICPEYVDVLFIFAIVPAELLSVVVTLAVMHMRAMRATVTALAPSHITLECKRAPTMLVSGLDANRACKGCNLNSAVIFVNQKRKTTGTLSCLCKEPVKAKLVSANGPEKILSTHRSKLSIWRAVYCSRATSRNARHAINATNLLARSAVPRPIARGIVLCPS